MPASIYDIARSLNLSAMTVSRALNQTDKSYVSPETRRRVMQAAHELGYTPNRNARALVTKRTNSISVWIDHLHSSVYAQIAEACRSQIQSAGYDVTICEMGWHFQEPSKYHRAEWAVDGVIAVDPPGENELEEYLKLLPGKPSQRVNIGSGHAVAWGGDYVRVDLQKGTRAAVAHLIAQGCRRIAYAVPSWIDKPGLGNFDAFTNTMLAAGLKPEYIPHSNWSLPGIREATRNYIIANGAPDGIFCHYDEIAIASFRAIRDLKLYVPLDIMIIGCEGNEFMAYFDPPLSTVAMPVEEMCNHAWKLLQRRMLDPKAPAEVVSLSYEFQSRESSIRSAHHDNNALPLTPES